MVRMKRPAAVLDIEHAKPRNAEESLPGEGTSKAPVPVVKMEPGQFPPIPKRDAQNMHKKLAKQKKAGRTDLAEKYQKCHSQQEKREFFYTTYSLDPEVSKKAVTKSDLDSESTVTKSTTGWFTKDQVAQDKGVLPSNPRYSELLDASVAGLKERPHEDTNLASLEVKQYQYTMTKTVAKSEQKRSLELKEGLEDVSTGDFTAMRQALQGAPQSTMIGNRQAALPPKPEEGHQSEEEISKEDAYKHAWKKAKSALNAMTTELSGTEMLKQQLSAIGGEQLHKLKTAYLEQVEKNSVHLKEFLKGKMAEFVAFPGKGSEVLACNLEGNTTKLVDMSKTLVDEHKEYKKKWLQSRSGLQTQSDRTQLTCSANVACLDKGRN